MVFGRTDEADTWAKLIDPEAKLAGYGRARPDVSVTSLKPRTVVVGQTLS